MYGLSGKCCTKPDSQAAGKNDNCVPPEQPPADEAPVEEVVGKSSFDADKFMDSFREIAKEAAAEAAREVVPLIVMDLGKPLRCRTARINPKKSRRFRYLLKNWTIYSPLTPSVSLPAKLRLRPMQMPTAIDFEEMQTAIKVLKNHPQHHEDEQTARRVVSELEGTEIIEYVKLDPVVRKRILMIECQLPDVPEDAPAVKTDEAIEKVRKIVFHADIDTTDIDAIDFNILH